jgi:hypothetical protein
MRAILSRTLGNLDGLRMLFLGELRQVLFSDDYVVSD